MVNDDILIRERREADQSERRDQRELPPPAPPRRSAHRVLRGHRLRFFGLLLCRLLFLCRMKSLSEIFEERFLLDRVFFDPKKFIFKGERRRLVSPYLVGRGFYDRDLGWDLSVPKYLTQISVASRVELKAARGSGGLWLRCRRRRRDFGWGWCSRRRSGKGLPLIEEIIKLAEAKAKFTLTSLRWRRVSRSTLCDEIVAHWCGRFSTRGDEMIAHWCGRLSARGDEMVAHRNGRFSARGDEMIVC